MQGTSRISFEFFPPKSSDGRKNLIQSAQKLCEFSPEFFSVTFGAGGSTREGTLETVQHLQMRTSIDIAPHLACMGLLRDELIDILKRYQSIGVKRMVALRGDLPSGMVARGEFGLAYDLVKLVREISGDYFYIEVAAYPEYHPQAKNALYDIFNLKKKSEAGANSAITQYFFNADAYFYFLDECAKQQIYMPIVPGVMPITNLDRLVRFSRLCGAEIPRWLYQRLACFGEDVTSIKAYGVEVIYKLCQRLLAGGAPGLHFYSLNQADACVAILKALNFTEKTLPLAIN